MKRAYYSDSIQNFLQTEDSTLIGFLTTEHGHSQEITQRDAWRAQIQVLRTALKGHEGAIYFEYSIPRMGRRIDVLLLIGPAILVLEFKVGESDYPVHALDQVMDYALDLKNFHESSHSRWIAPILVSTKAQFTDLTPVATPQGDNVLLPLKTNSERLTEAIQEILRFIEGGPIDRAVWEQGRYCPTPTIVEAAMALYKGHAVEEISRSDASAINLSTTSQSISQIILRSRMNSEKAVCFVTGVPGAGKTLVGLNIATQYIDKASDLYSVFLSGNGPLVAILREALTRDRVRAESACGRKLRKGDAKRKVDMFIQNVHHFRDEYIADQGPPIDHVALFDEAQRAWNLKQTSSFMRRKKGQQHFHQSEPEFLLSCMDRHPDWAVVVCLVGGGQEINTGEAGISEWVAAMNRSFPKWRVYLSSRLTDSEYGAGEVIANLQSRPHVEFKDELHLSVSMRSFRSERVSLFVKQLLDLDADSARQTLEDASRTYPIVLTRDLARAKKWLREKARGSERFGLIASSQAERLRPHAIHVKSPMDPIHWFLDGKEDVRSSYYLEDVATEFAVQGLELDWACVVWDGDFRYSKDGWEHWSFVGSRWNRIRKVERQAYLKNAYRVLLTRARQGMVIVVPEGDLEDPTRRPEFYDHTYRYLASIGIELL